MINNVFNKFFYMEIVKLVGLNDFFNSSQAGSNNLNVRVYFDRLDEKVVDKIKSSDYVVGCICWFTSSKIINALKEKEGVSLIMDKVNASRLKGPLLTSINEIPPVNVEVRTLGMGYAFCEPEILEGIVTEPLRVVGVSEEYQGNYKRALFHHKFMVFCDKDEDGRLKPKSLITGSYNFTENGTRCRENIVFINDVETAGVYYGEWQKCCLLSESIKDFSEGMNPQYLDLNSLEDIIELNEEEDSRIEVMSDAYLYSQGKGFYID